MKGRQTTRTGMALATRGRDNREHYIPTAIHLNTKKEKRKPFRLKVGNEK